MLKRDQDPCRVLGFGRWQTVSFQGRNPGSSPKSSILWNTVHGGVELVDSESSISEHTRAAAQAVCGSTPLLTMWVKRLQGVPCAAGNVGSIAVTLALSEILSQFPGSPALGCVVLPEFAPPGEIPC